MPFQFTCEQCGAPFTQPSRKSSTGPYRYCSHACSQAAQRTRPKTRICEVCGKTFPQRRGGKLRRYCSLICHGSTRRRDNYSTYIESSSGYVLVKLPGGRRMAEHRWIAEQLIVVRPLGFNDVVHHVNGDRSDNRIENLQVMSRSEHTALHRQNR